MDVGVVVGIVLGLVALRIAFLVIFWLLRLKDVSIRELIGVVPDLVRMLRAIVRDPASPIDVRAVLVGLLVWIVHPST